jgi:Uma2 family endonuclease
MVQQTTLPRLVRGEWVPITSEEFDAWVPDGMQAEWVDGKGIIFVSTSTLHGELAVFFTELLRHYLLLFDLGRVFAAPVELRLPSSGQRREPDIFVVLTPHLYRVKRMWVDGPADFVVEFVSEWTAREDRVVKFRAYAAAGVREYLLIDTREGKTGIEFYRLGDNGQYHALEPDAQGRFHSVVLPGFWFDASWFHLDPLPRTESLLLEIAPDAYERWFLAEIQARRQGGTQR